MVYIYEEMEASVEMCRLELCYMNFIQQFSFDFIYNFIVFESRGLDK